MVLYFSPSPAQCPGTDRPDAPAQGFGALASKGSDIDLSKWFESPGTACRSDNIFTGDAEEAVLRYVDFGLSPMDVTPSSRLRLDPWVFPSTLHPLRDTAWVDVPNAQTTALVQ